jgi:alpha-tubulin suppressor-like RCC1 family protein
MVVSLKHKVFVWGEGTHGKLGLDDDEDVLVPTENEDLSKLKVEFLSCGESHSAAISDKLKLYTWGSGSYGRLGHGMDQSERRPKVVVNMEDFECIYVSCGAFHTFAVTAEGNIYAFGQGKHGKLGISRQDGEMKVVGLPEKIPLYKTVEGTKEVVQDK